MNNSHMDFYGTYQCGYHERFECPTPNLECKCCIHYSDEPKIIAGKKTVYKERLIQIKRCTECPYIRQNVIVKKLLKCSLTDIQIGEFDENGIYLYNGIPRECPLEDYIHE